MGSLVGMRLVLRLAVVFALGAVLGTALDHLHVAGGVLGYPDPRILGHAAWAPPVFGLAAVAFSSLALVLSRAEPRPPSWRVVAADAGLFVAAYGATAAVPAHSATLLAGLGIAWVSRAIAGRDPAWRLGHALACAALGVAAEAALVAAGAFRHHHPDVLGLPAWLPALYLCAAPLLADVGERLRPVDPFRSAPPSAT